MDNRTAKALAARLGCDLWWDPKAQIWALHKLGADEVEASGGCYISAGQLRTLPAPKFAEWCVAALGTPVSKTDELMQIARYDLAAGTHTGRHEFAAQDHIAVRFNPRWVEGTQFEFFHNGVRIDEARARELIG